jgi:hypothetical protein
MMPQDFPSSMFEQAARLATAQAAEARTAAALAALSDRIEALSRELRGAPHHDARDRLATARHQRRHRV